MAQNVVDSGLEDVHFMQKASIQQSLFKLFRLYMTNRRHFDLYLPEYCSMIQREAWYNSLTGEEMDSRKRFMETITTVMEATKELIFSKDVTRDKHNYEHSEMIAKQAIPNMSIALHLHIARFTRAALRLGLMRRHDIEMVARNRKHGFYQNDAVGNTIWALLTSDIFMPNDQLKQIQKSPIEMAKKDDSANLGRCIITDPRNETATMNF